jgi:hypothetical protein
MRPRTGNLTAPTNYGHTPSHLIWLHPSSPGPVRVSVGTIRGLYSFVPWSSTVQPQPHFVYLQRTDDNMSSDLEWHLLRVPETILTRYFN